MAKKTNWTKWLIYGAVAVVGINLLKRVAGASVTRGGGGGMPGDGLGPTSTQVAFGPSTLPPRGWKLAFTASRPVGASFTGDITKNEAPYAATDATLDPATGKYVHYWATVMLPAGGYSKVRVVPA